jgi:hypothetical protein
MKTEQAECSEMLAFKLQIPVNHPEESMQKKKKSNSINIPVPVWGFIIYWD